MNAGRPAGEHVLPALLKPGEEVRSVDQPVFGDLGIACSEFARGQRIEHAGVGKHDARLVENTDEVLAVPSVNARLAANRGIDLGKQRSRHLDKIHAAPDDAGREAGEVADHAAAQCDHRIAAFEPCCEHLVHDVLKRSKAFRPLPSRHYDRQVPDARLIEACLKRRQVSSRNVVVCNDRRTHARQAGRNLLSRTADQAFADDDVVAARTEPYFDCRPAGLAHAVAPSIAASRWPSASITSATMISFRSSRVKTVTSAVA